MLPLCFPNASLKDALRELPEEESKKLLYKIYKLKNVEDFSKLKNKILLEATEE